MSDPVYVFGYWASSCVFLKLLWYGINTSTHTSDAFINPALLSFEFSTVHDVRTVNATRKCAFGIDRKPLSSVMALMSLFFLKPTGFIYLA
jgi:hypothetical protein